MNDASGRIRNSLSRLRSLGCARVNREGCVSLQ
jgi:hypothetical protein